MSSQKSARKRQVPVEIDNYVELMATSVLHASVEIDNYVELMATSVLHASVNVESVSRILHVSYASSPNRVWVCDFDNLILTDLTGTTRDGIEKGEKM
jgi:hypothetical protein